MTLLKIPNFLKKDEPLIKSVLHEHKSWINLESSLKTGKEYHMRETWVNDTLNLFCKSQMLPRYKAFLQSAGFEIRE